MKRSRRGFTLIEMLVAVAVLAIALAAIIAGMARYTDNAARLRQRTIALWIAHNRLAETQLQLSWPDIGKSDGDLQMAGRSWRWRTSVTKTPDEHLRRVDIEIEPADDKQTAARLTGFVADTGHR